MPSGVSSVGQRNKLELLGLIFLDTSRTLGTSNDRNKDTDRIVTSTSTANCLVQLGSSNMNVSPISDILIASMSIHCWDV